MEDYLVQLGDLYDDLSRRNGESWSVTHSDGDEFTADFFGRSPTSDRQSVVVADLNGDGVADIAGFAGGLWRAGITDFRLNLLDTGEVDTTDPVNWYFEYQVLDRTMPAPAQLASIWGIDFDGNSRMKWRSGPPGRSGCCRKMAASLM